VRGAARNERASSHSGLDAAQIAAYAAIFNAEVSSSTRTIAAGDRAADRAPGRDLSNREGPAHLRSSWACAAVGLPFPCAASPIPLLRSLYEPGVARTNAGYRVKWLKIAATATARITILSADARRRFGSNSLTATYNTAATEQITMFERLRTKASIIGGPSTRAEVFSSQA
jgi:hypothetical protein